MARIRERKLVLSVICPTHCTYSPARLLLSVFWISCVLTISYAADQCGLAVKLANGQEYNDACIDEFNNAECKIFSKTFDRNSLPTSLSTEKFAIERPSTLNVKESVSPGLSLSWSSPASESARHSLMGFLLLMTSNSSSIDHCYLFQVNHSENARRKMTFKYEVQYPIIQPSKTYEVRVYSLPPPDSSVKDDPDQFITTMVQVGSLLASVFPAEWTPTINYKTSPDTIQFCFDLAPKSHNFTSYKILLTVSYDPYNKYREAFYNVTDLDTETEGCVIFKNLPPGRYSGTVNVVDPYRNEDGLCVCWTQRHSHQRYCKSSCAAERTRFITVEAASRKNTSPSTTTVTTTSPESKSEESSETYGTEISVGVGITITMVLILVLAIWACRHKNCWTKLWRVICCKSQRSSLKSGKTSENEKDFNISSSPIYKVISDKKGPLKVKTVYILSADDHPAHERLVDCLATFLQVHCNCDVIYPRWSPVHQDGGFTWVVANITQSDLILFIDSIGAEKLLRAFLDKMMYPQRKVGPEGDLFSLGLKHIFAQQETERIIPVCFRGKQGCKKILLASIELFLPAHLPQLLQRIHGLSMRELESYTTSLPLRVENLKNLPEGAALLSAMKDVTQYENANSNWLEETFGEPAPLLKLKHSPSKDSACNMSFSAGESGLIQSVSTQDLTFSDYAGSPVSVFERPDLPTSSVPADFSPPASDRRNEKRVPEDNKDVPLSTFTAASGYYSLNEDPTIAFKEAGNINHDNEALLRVIPPESASNIICDSVSTALQEVNQRNDPSIGHQLTTLPNGIIGGLKEEKEMNYIGDIQAPDSFSAVGSDNISFALQEVNRRNDPDIEHPRKPLSNGNIQDSKEEKEVNFLGDIQAPDSLSAVDIDNVTLALQEINANTERHLKFNNSRAGIGSENGVENLETGLEYDAVNV